ncbi:MAG: hypothetical protein ISS93_01795 [Candidatus Aenigmarchaeota archaeon]|nr:hypothetical protein [Candidatus Aenigmarchaeota archaeon]
MFGVIGFIIGILLIIAGVFLIFFFPAAGEHQPHGMSLTGIVLGIIFLILGFVLILL